jgi:hypothetical protein
MSANSGSSLSDGAVVEDFEVRDLLAFSGLRERRLQNPRLDDRNDMLSG